MKRDSCRLAPATRLGERAVVVRDFITQLSTAECNTLSNRVQVALSGADLLRSALLEAAVGTETVADLDHRVTMMIEELEALRAMLRQPALR
jgi:hypothetical protein